MSYIGFIRFIPRHFSDPLFLKEHFGNVKKIHCGLIVLYFQTFVCCLYSKLWSVNCYCRVLFGLHFFFREALLCGCL